MGYSRDVEELSIEAALNGGCVFEYVGSAGDNSCASFRYLVENMEFGLRSVAARAGFGPDAPRAIRWGAHKGCMVYCVGLFRAPTVLN